MKNKTTFVLKAVAFVYIAALIGVAFAPLSKAAELDASTGTNHANTY